METPDVLTEDATDLDGVKRRVVQFALGYLGLACLAVYIDYRIRLRRARKRREADEGFMPNEDAWFKKGDDDDGARDP